MSLLRNNNSWFYFLLGSSVSKPGIGHMGQLEHLQISPFDKIIKGCFSKVFLGEDVTAHSDKQHTCGCVCACVSLHLWLTMCAQVLRKVWMFVSLTQRKGKHCLCFTGCNSCCSQLPLITFGSRKLPFSWRPALFHWIGTKEKHKILEQLFNHVLPWAQKSVYKTKLDCQCKYIPLLFAVICVMFRCLGWEMSMKGREGSTLQVYPTNIKTETCF